MNEPLPWQGTVNFPRPVPLCSTNLLLPYFEAAAKEMRGRHARLQTRRKLIPLGPITLATTTAPLLAGGLSLLSGGLGSRTIVSPLPTHQTWPSHRLAGPKSACSPHRGRHDDKRPQSWSHHQLVFQCLAHGIDEGRRQPPTAGRGRHSPTSQSEGFAGHRVRRHDTSPPPIAVGARDHQRLVSHRPRHRTTAAEPQQRRRTMPSNHGIGERVQPDRQVPLLVRSPTGRARIGQVR